MKIAEFFLDEPYVVKTNHFLFSPECFVGVVAVKNGKPYSLTVIDEKMRVWGVPKDAVQIVEKADWPEWAVEMVDAVNPKTLKRDGE